MDCIFCKIVSNEIPSYKIYEDETLLVLLDINPVEPGHTLIIPKKHILDLQEIDNDTLIKILDKAKEISQILTKKLNTNGYSLVQNNGICQEIKHYHLHIIPKYNKKTNMNIEEVYNKIMN